MTIFGVKRLKDKPLPLQIKEIPWSWWRLLDYVGIAFALILYMICATIYFYLLLTK